MVHGLASTTPFGATHHDTRISFMNQVAHKVAKWIDTIQVHGSAMPPEPEQIAEALRVLQADETKVSSLRQKAFSLLPLTAKDHPAE